MKSLSTINYFSYSPFILLVFSLLSWYFFPIIPMASGFGWDGVFYGNIGLEFHKMIGHIDSYHAGRIFPGVLIHYFLFLFKLPLTLSSVLIGYRIYYIIILFFSGVLWVSICKLLQLNQINSWIGFIALFVSYPVLNLYFYYPALTDGTTLFIGITLIYVYLKPNNFILLLISTISFFSWPTGIIMCFAIFVYGGIKNNFWGLEVAKISRFLLIMLLISPLILAVITIPNVKSFSYFLIDFNIHGGFLNKIIANFPGNRYNFVVIVNCIIIIAYYAVIYWALLKDFNFTKFIQLSFKKQLLFKILVAFIVLILLSVLKRHIIDYSLPTVTPLFGYIIPVLNLSSRFTLQFIIGQVTYWGPLMLLIIFFYKEILAYLKKSDLAITLGLFFAILLSVNAESRAITNFYPFLVFIVLKVVNFSKISNLKWFMGCFIIISIIYSKIWLIIDIPRTTFPKTITNNLDKFPMQWYFMNFGLWINYNMYLIHALSVIIFAAILYLLLKNNSKAKSNFS